MCILTGSFCDPQMSFSECPSAVSESPFVGSHHSWLSLLPCPHYPGISIPAGPAHPAGYLFLGTQLGFHLVQEPHLPTSQDVPWAWAIAAVFTFSLQLELALGHKAWCWLLET